MPDHGHYKVAIQEDDELARRQRDLAEQSGRTEDNKPSKAKVDPRVWTPERAVLTDVADILLGIRASLEASRTGKRQKAAQMPRPRLARDRVAHSETYRRHRERVALLLPGRG